MMDGIFPLDVDGFNCNSTSLPYAVVVYTLMTKTAAIMKNLLLDDSVRNVTRI